MRRLRQVVATVTTVAVVGLSAACGGDNPEPSSAPSTSMTEREGANPSPKPPEAPKAVSANTRQGAIAAVRYFLTAMAYAGETGDIAAFRQSFTPSCTKCEAIASGIERTYQAGGSIEGGNWEPTGFKVYGIANDVAFVDAAVDYTQQSYVAERGATPDQVPPQKNILKAFQLKWDGSWRVGALDPEA